MSGQELRLRCKAHARSVAPIRHALRSFLEALGFDRRTLDDVTTATGEALANVVEHAYAKNRAGREVELLVRLHRGSLAIDVCDSGSFMNRDPLPGRGFGLRIIRAIARHTSIETGNGTRVRMRFPGPASKS